MHQVPLIFPPMCIFNHLLLFSFLESPRCCFSLSYFQFHPQRPCGTPFPLLLAWNFDISVSFIFDTLQWIFFITETFPSLFVLSRKFLSFFFFLSPSPYWNLSSFWCPCIATSDCRNLFCHCPCIPPFITTTPFSTSLRRSLLIKFFYRWNIGGFHVHWFHILLQDYINMPRQ